MTGKKAHIMCILDMSGSMSGTQREIVKSFNTFVDEQKEERGDAYLSLVFFDDEYQLIYDKIDIKDAKHITTSMYEPRGMTAMYDAIGKTVEKYKNDNGYVIIQTDGHENSSTKFDKQKITSLIQKKESEGWDFLLMGADISATDVGDKIGLGAKALQFDKTSKGIEVAYSAMSNAASQYRASLDTVILTPNI